MPEFFSAFISLLQESVDLVDPLFKMTPAHQSLEYCGDLVLELGYEYLMVLDCDTTFIPRNAVQRLLEHKKDVVFAHSFQRGYPYPPAPLVKVPGRNPDGKKPFLESAADVVWPNQGLMKVWNGSLQMALIKSCVLEKIPKPWFQNNPVAGVDWYFYQLCEDNGIDVWCDTELQVDHHNLNIQTFMMYKKLWVELKTQHTEMMSM